MLLSQPRSQPIVVGVISITVVPESAMYIDDVIVTIDILSLDVMQPPDTFLDDVILCCAFYYVFFIFV